MSWQVYHFPRNLHVRRRDCASTAEMRCHLRLTNTLAQPVQRRLVSPGELAQARRAWGTSVRDVVNPAGDAGSTRPGRLASQVQVITWRV